MEISYPGAIVNIMTGSGLKEVLELIYGENVVGYIFGRKALQEVSMDFSSWMLC